MANPADPASPFGASGEPRVTTPGPPVRATPIPPTDTRAPGAVDDRDWPVAATDTIVNLVDQVRDKTTGSVLTVARGIVFGLIAAILGLILVVLLLIAMVRLLDNVLPSGVWLAYLVLGVLFTLVGAVLFRKRKAVAAPASTA